MKVTFFTNEYPPHVYGGAGVHIKNLSAQLSKSIEDRPRSLLSVWSAVIDRTVPLRERITSESVVTPSPR